jgi:sulfoxide reductase heme-binding subunit YedZ
MASIDYKRFDKPLVFLLCLGPALWIASLAANDLLDLGWNKGLGVNPIEYLNRTLGDWAMRMILVTLAVTPVRLLTGWAGVLRYRRMLGLFAFFYACLHFSTWLVLDWFFDFGSMAADIVERPFITIGMLTFLLLIPLAAMSTAGMIRRLGKRWLQLHRLVYLAGLTAVIHFWWVVKADFREPRLFALALSVLLGFRAWWVLRPRLSSRS